MRIHNFSNRHPVLGVVPVFLSFYALVSLVGGIGDAVLHWTKILPMGLCTIACSVAGMIGYRWYFAPLFMGWFRPGGLLKGLVCLLPFIAETSYVVTSCGVRLRDVTIDAVVLALYAGISEEFLYRGVFCSFLMRSERREEKLLPIVFASAAHFGLVHFTNAALGAKFSFLLLQALNAFAVGVLFAAAYLRTGSLLATMVMHTLYDLACFCVNGTDTFGIVADEAATAADFIETGITAAVYIAFALFLLRRPVRGNILYLWSERWRLPVFRYVTDD